MFEFGDKTKKYSISGEALLRLEEIMVILHRCECLSHKDYQSFAETIDEILADIKKQNEPNVGSPPKIIDVYDNGNGLWEPEHI